jgi:DNA-binding response OmpR family regulator
VTSSPIDSGQPLQVLLVESDLEYAAYVQDHVCAMPELKVALTHAVSLAQADRILNDGAIHLVLLAVVLPDGRAAEWLASRTSGGGAPPVIVLTAVAGDPDVGVALGAGARDVIVKSSSQSYALTRALRHAIEVRDLREQLQQTVRRLLHLHEMDFLTVLDLEGSVVYASPSAHLLLGVRPELVGSRLWDRVHVEDILLVQTLVLELASEPLTTRDFRFRVLDAHNTWRTLDAVGRPLTDGSRWQILIKANGRSAPGHVDGKPQRRARQDARGAGWARVPTPARGPAGASEVILLVDDEPGVRALVRDMLESAGYTVLDVEFPKLAETICREHAGPIHLLLTDVVMPEMSGWEVATRVRALRPETKVLFISGYPSYPGTPSQLANFAGCEFLAKPFDRRALLARVRAVLDVPPERDVDGS